jgi:hypothetical protein
MLCVVKSSVDTIQGSDEKVHDENDGKEPGVPKDETNDDKDK